MVNSGFRRTLAPAGRPRKASWTRHPVVGRVDYLLDALAVGVGAYLLVLTHTDKITRAHSLRDSLEPEHSPQERRCCTMFQVHLYFTLQPNAHSTRHEMHKRLLDSQSRAHSIDRRSANQLSTVCARERHRTQAHNPASRRLTDI